MGYKNKKWIISTIAFILVFYESTFTLMDTRATLNFFVISTLHQKPFAILLIQKAWGNRGALARTMPPLRTRAIPGSTPGVTTTGDAVIIPLRPSGGTYGPSYGPVLPNSSGRPGGAPRPAPGGPYDQEVGYCNNGYMDACPVGTEVSNQNGRPIPQPGAFWRCWGDPTNCSKWKKVSTLAEATPYPRDAGPQLCPPGGCQGTPPRSRYSSPVPGPPDELGRSRQGPQYQGQPTPPWSSQDEESIAIMNNNRQAVELGKQRVTQAKRTIFGLLEKDPQTDLNRCREAFWNFKSAAIKKHNDYNWWGIKNVTGYVAETWEMLSPRDQQRKLNSGCKELDRCLKTAALNFGNRPFCMEECRRALQESYNLNDPQDPGFTSFQSSFGNYCVDLCKKKAEALATQRGRDIKQRQPECR
jgi:hypothetical protein